MQQKITSKALKIKGFKENVDAVETVEMNKKYLRCQTAKQVEKGEKT